MGRNIKNFKLGDAIVRVEPAKEYSPLRTDMFGTHGGVRDRSYIGEKLIFKGIANGQIYLERTDDLEISLFKRKELNLALDIFDDGWDSWVEPNTLTNGNIPSCNEDYILKMIEDLVKNENYEILGKIKKMINGEN